MKKIFIVFTAVLMVALLAYANTFYEILDVDNLRLDVNTLSATNTDGDVTLQANGTGSVVSGSVLEIQNGSSSAPGLAFESDTDTGLYRVTTNTLGVAANGIHSYFGPSYIRNFGNVPRLDLTDTDTTDQDVNGRVQINCTDTGSGTEDCDLSFQQQRNGTLTEVQKFDADGLIEYKVATALSDQKENRYFESVANGAHYIGLRAPASVTASQIFNLPDGDGLSGQAIVTDGSGNLSFDSVSGSSILSINSQTSGYTALTSDDVILASSAAFTVTLYTAVGNAGKQLIIKKTDSSLTNIITIDGNASETIDGDTTTTLNTEGEAIRIVSDGSNWQILERKIPSKANSYTMTIGGVTSSPTKATTPDLDSAYWWREGSKIRIRYSYSHTNNTGSAVGSGFYLFPLPSGVTANTTINPANAGSLRAINIIGLGYSDNGSTRAYGYTKLYDSSNIVFFTETTAGSANGVGSSHYTMVNATIYYYIEALVSVSGWSD